MPGSMGLERLWVVTGIRSLDFALAGLLGFLLVLTVTWIFTEIRFWFQMRGTACRITLREPPSLPYVLPWAGGFYRMLDPHAMYAWAINKSKGRPATLRVGPLNIYLLFGENNMKAIFKNSKSLDKSAATAMIFKNSGMPTEDLHIFTADKSGTGIAPLVEIPEEQRIWRITHQNGVENLMHGNPVNILTDKFMDFFVAELKEQPIGIIFEASINQYFKKVMFRASTNAMFGTEFLKLVPDFQEIYWDWDVVFPLVVLGVPKFVYPKGYHAKIRMLKATKTWIEAGWKNLDPKDAESQWEPHFGSKFIRNLLVVLRDGGLSVDGQAAGLITMIWTVNANVIPSTVWALLETLQRPGLLSTLRNEILPTISNDTSSRVPPLDITALVSSTPLLHSIYQECLRIRNSNTITRQLEYDVECDGCVLKRGNFIMSPSWTPSHGPLWEVPGHCPSEFWPERFIEMPKMEAYKGGKSKFEVAMRPGNFFPYGGGSAICTGRFFAKQEMLSAVALFIAKFDIETLHWVDSKGKKVNGPAKPDESYAGTGILPPDRDLKVRLTRRS